MTLVDFPNHVHFYSLWYNTTLQPVVKPARIILICEQTEAVKSTARHAIECCVKYKSFSLSPWAIEQQRLAAILVHITSRIKFLCSCAPTWRLVVTSSPNTLSNQLKPFEISRYLIVLNYPKLPMFIRSCILRIINSK